ncbi:MAG: hypothetical protein IIB41_01040 [Candidatus Marinimicrobia bacterium]|nr:hypothetical protein [Candidatus Neomarinimicrobiota bacterium]
MRQKTLFLLTFIMLILSIGCSSVSTTLRETLNESTHLIQPDEPLHIKKYATLFKKDFQEINISEFHTSRDSIKVLHSDTNELLEYSKSDINKIVIKNRLKGSLLWASYGVIAATVLNLILPEEDNDGSFGSDEDVFNFFLKVYAIMGAIGGYVEGYREIYVFDTPESNNIKAKNEIEVIKTEEKESNDVYELNTDKPEEKEGIEESGKADVEESKPPAIEIVKDPKIEETHVKKRMIAISVKPPTTPSKYYALRVGQGFGNIPAIKNLEGSTENENSGSGFGAAYQLWFPVKSNIHIGLIAGGIEFSQEDGNVRRTRFVEYISFAARKYIKNKNEYIEAAISLSRLSQESISNDDFSVLSKSSINGFGISAGIGTILIRGKQYEILLNGNFAYNFFKGGRNSALFGFNVELMLPRLITK